MVSSHGLPWLTLVSDRVVYIIFYFNILNLYVLCFKNIYMYYERNTNGIWLCPDPALLEKVFKLACDFKRNYPQTIFSIYDVLIL